MKYTNIYIFILIVFTSCGVSNGFYKRVSENTKEFNKMSRYLIENDLLKKNDSIVLEKNDDIFFKNKCIYNDSKDDFIRVFMFKYELNNICRYDDNPNLIYFTKDATPYFSTSRVVYDNGDSYLRENVQKGQTTDKGKIIDSTLIFIYSN